NTTYAQLQRLISNLQTQQCLAQQHIKHVELERDLALTELQHEYKMHWLHDLRKVQDAKHGKKTTVRAIIERVSLERSIKRIEEEVGKLWGRVLELRELLTDLGHYCGEAGCSLRDNDLTS